MPTERTIIEYARPLPDRKRGGLKRWLAAAGYSASACGTMCIPVAILLLPMDLRVGAIASGACIGMLTLGHYLASEAE